MSTNPYQSPQPEPECPLVKLPRRRFWRFLQDAPALKYPLAISWGLAVLLLTYWLLFDFYADGLLPQRLAPGVPWPHGLPVIALTIVATGSAIGLMAGWLA
jgi:hypothetical protein